MEQKLYSSGLNCILKQYYVYFRKVNGLLNYSHWNQQTFHLVPKDLKKFRRIFVIVYFRAS